MKSYMQPSQGFIDEKRQQRMGEIDRLAPDMRELVHEYGWTVVKSFLDCGVRAPNRIRHLVETVLNEFSPTRGSYSSQGPRRQRDLTPTQASAFEGHLP